MASSIETDLAQALQRSRAKQAVSEALKSLPIADRRAVLFDVLAEVPTSAPPKAAVPQAQRVNGERVGRPPRASGAVTVGKTDAIVDALKGQPRMPIAQLSAKVYGDADRASQGKTRSLLAALKKQGRVKSVGVGQWEAA